MLLFTMLCVQYGRHALSILGIFLERQTFEESVVSTAVASPGPGLPMDLYQFAQGL